MSKPTFSPLTGSLLECDNCGKPVKARYKHTHVCPTDRRIRHMQRQSLNDHRLTEKGLEYIAGMGDEK